MNGPIRVLLACGNEAIIERINQMLSSEEEIVVVGKMRGDEQVLAETRRLSPDVVILLTDDTMSGVNVIDTARAITEAQLPARLIIMTENLTRDLVPAIRAGAASILARIVSRDELLSAIHKIHLWSPGLF